MPRTRAEIEETLTLRLAGGDQAPARARRALESLENALGDARSDVALLVSELVTNSIRHGGGQPDSAIEVVASAAPDVVRVEVADRGPGFDAEEAHRERPVGGYGLKLVEKLTNRWGITQNAGSRVWFEIHRNGSGRAGQKQFARSAHG
jgi:anti-sigma regulatory factor (Ser/Thr protein kinase)